MLMVAAMLPTIGIASECALTLVQYTACKPGYYKYKSGMSCTLCPTFNGVRGQSADQNSSGITACYIPAGTAFSDDSGTGIYTENCYYSSDS